jgi:peptidoglycan/xylan/chitin deacetylase (PgdA/CDA1 family)
MIRNFLFHRVNPQRDALWDPMDLQLFDKCIAYISKKYKVVLFEDLVESELLNSKNKVATIMFDDGYLDNYEFAASILEKYNCKASFYVVTDSIEKNELTWTHQLEYLFQNTSITDFSINYSFFEDEYHATNLPDLDSKLSYLRKTLPRLKKLKHDQRELFISDLIKKANDIQFPKLMMNWDQVRELRNMGHYIGSHTVTHVMLGTIVDEAIVRKELFESGIKIQQELGYFPKTISYPVGSFNENVKKISKEVGYTIGLAVKQDIYNPKSSDPFEVDRIELYNESWFKTKLRISNRLEQIKKLIKYK